MSHKATEKYKIIKHETLVQAKEKLSSRCHNFSAPQVPLSLGKTFNANGCDGKLSYVFKKKLLTHHLELSPHYNFLPDANSQACFCCKKKLSYVFST